MLQMILDHGYIDDDGVLTIPSEDWQIDLLCNYGADDADLEDGDDDEDFALTQA